MWNTVDKEPSTGKPVCAAVGNKVFVAYYCNFGFYILAYDDLLGVMRKQYLDGVTSWTDLDLPNIA